MEHCAQPICLCIIPPCSIFPKKINNNNNKIQKLMSALITEQFEMMFKLKLLMQEKHLFLITLKDEQGVEYSENML